MPSNNRIGSKAAPYMRTENNGMFNSPGPYIGIIKNNIDPTRAGRLQVYVPNHGGPNENDPGNWITVSYASPFRGQTRQRNDLDLYIDTNVDITSTDGYIQENSFQSYGFWFVPPDLNGRVLCFFVNSDPSQGYWTSCVQDSMDAHMVPAIGSVTAAPHNQPNSGGYIWSPSGANAIPSHALLQTYIEISGDTGTEIPYRLPVSEPVITNQAQSNPTTPTEVKMVPQVFQTRQLGIQGLAFDFIRGTTSASSVRENPSQVFGVSTPGRLSSFANAVLSQSVLSQLQSFINSDPNQPLSQNSATQSYLQKALNSAYRTGGHQLVLDDGTVDGLDQGIRIRTTAGNQIILDDTNGQIYVINSQGTAWVELSPSGYIDIYSMKDFSVRTQGSLNLHADNDININAGGAFNVKSGSDIKFDSGGKTTLRSSGGFTTYDPSFIKIGTGGGITFSGATTSFSAGSAFNVQTSTLNLSATSVTKITDPGAIQQNNQIAVKQQSPNLVWWQDGTFKSICERAPAHEPWPNHEINGIITFNVAQGTADVGAISRPQSGSTSSGVRGTTIGTAVNEAEIAQQPLNGPVCGLTAKQTGALMAALGKHESGWPHTSGVTSWSLSNGGRGYYAVNQLGYSGKYQFGAAALETFGFLKPGSSHTGTTAQVIGNSSNWAGFLNCHNANDWLSNADAQEKAMIALLKRNCQQLQKWGILTSKSSPEDIAGYLSICHLVGTGGALTYYRQTNPNSQLNTSYKGSRTTADANGSTAGSYYALGSNAVQIVG